MSDPTRNRMADGLGLHFQQAQIAVDQYFGKDASDSNAFLVVTVARLIGEQERARELREVLVMLCDTLRALGVNESLDDVRRSIDALQEEVSAVAVAINSISS